MSQARTHPLPPRLLTAEEVADTLNVSLRTVRRLIDTGRLQVIRIGRSVRVSQEALDAYVTASDRR